MSRLRHIKSLVLVTTHLDFVDAVATATTAAVDFFALLRSSRLMISNYFLDGLVGSLAVYLLHYVCKLSRLVILHEEEVTLRKPWHSQLCQNIIFHPLFFFLDIKQFFDDFVVKHYVIGGLVVQDDPLLQIIVKLLQSRALYFNGYERVTSFCDDRMNDQ